METNFNFNSAICTSVEQSRKLLELGLKKETADMTHHYLNSIDSYELKDIEFSRVMHLQELVNKKPVLGRSGDDLYAKDVPAWSLHRLISLTNTDNIKIACNEKHCWGGNVLKIAQRKAFEKDNLYDNIVDSIEWLIKEGYFNKEYLV